MPDLGFGLTQVQPPFAEESISSPYFAHSVLLFTSACYRGHSKVFAWQNVRVLRLDSS